MSRNGEVRRRRRDRKDHAWPFLGHVRYDGLRGHEKGGQEAIDCPHELRQRQRVDPGALVVDETCGIHCYVDPAHSRGDGRDLRDCPLFIEHVDDEGLDHVRLRTDAVGSALEAVGASPADEHVGALARQHLRDRTADSTAAAEDHGGPACKEHPALLR
jgi:hypothetical protein